MPAHVISSEQQRDRMLYTPIPKLIVSLSVPTLASQLISVFYNTADTYFVSKLSTSASAAVGVVFSLMSIIQAFGFGIGMGCGSIISRSLGSRDNEQGRPHRKQRVLFCRRRGPSHLHCRPLHAPAAYAAAWLNGNDSPVLRKLRAHYSAGRARHVRVVRAEQHAALRGRGDALHVRHLHRRTPERRARPAVHLCLRYGHRGRGAGHSAQSAVSFCILAWLFLHGRSIVRVHLCCVSKRPGLYGEILLVGFPTICRQGFASLSSALLNNAAAVYSDAAVAAVTISNKVYLLVRSIVIGIGQGFQPVAGYNFGAGDKKRTRQAFWFSVLLGTAVCIVWCGCDLALSR